MSVRVCPRCGFSHLRPSRAHTWFEHVQGWWTRTRWFRCQTCEWRGRIRDLWSPDAAFPDLPPLRLGRELDIEILQQRDEEALVSLVLSHKDAIQRTVKLWLDDSRPAPPDWLGVATVRSAQRLLEAEMVHEVSLDYDLGWCADCIHRGEHLKHTGQRHCPHTPTGYDIDWPLGLSDNARTWVRAARDRDELVVFGSVHSFDRDIEAKLDEQVALGARGITVHPAVQMVKPDAARCMALYRACGARRLPVLFHCGPVDIETRLGRYLSQVRHYERAIAECPETNFVLGHSGALQLEEALGFAKRYPNVWLKLASQSLSNVKRLIDEAPPGRVVFGTDWPFYHQAIGLAKVLIATELRGSYPSSCSRVA